MNLTRREFAMSGVFCATLGVAPWRSTRARAASARHEVSVCVYGATLPGIAAAISAARRGSRAALVEKIDMVGGLVTSGLSHTDFRSFESLSGFFEEFMLRVQRYYVDKYGEDSPQVLLASEAHGEPHVNQRCWSRCSPNRTTSTSS